MSISKTEKILKMELSILEEKLKSEVEQRHIIQ